MAAPIKIMVVGFGNVGRGVLAALARTPDLKAVGILSRTPERVRKNIADIPVFPFSEAASAIASTGAEVAILCGGSKDDLPAQGPRMVELIATVDSFDNHSRIPEYFAAMDKAAKSAGHPALISIGWDPGIFSLERVLASAFLPGSRGYGFYGLSERGGLSMGHSDALRTIPGVLDARQYTHAIPEAMEKIRNGENPTYEPGDMHWRECFVVAAPDADRKRIEKTIREMPGYFAPYKTVINFVSQEELRAKFSGFPHDGCVLAAGVTGDGNPARVEYHCVWGSNPEATGNVLAAHARAAARLQREGRTGAFTILDLPATYLTPLDRDELLKHYL